MTSKIKICGITNKPDARLALQLGADYLGFNFYPPSPRYIDPACAAAIITALNAQHAAVALFVNAGLEQIRQVLSACPLRIVQLHGDESNKDCQAVKALALDVWKAVRIRRPADLDRLRQYDLETIVLDAFHKELYGGTGDRFDWTWITETSGRQIFLAGGIQPANVHQALTVGTYGLDVCSGVEKAPGLKDPDKLRTLFQEIAHHDQQ